MYFYQYLFHNVLIFQTLQTGLIYVNQNSIEFGYGIPNKQSFFLQQCHISQFFILFCMILVFEMMRLIFLILQFWNIGFDVSLSRDRQQFSEEKVKVEISENYFQLLLQEFHRITTAHLIFIHINVYLFNMQQRNFHLNIQINSQDKAFLYGNIQRSIVTVHIIISPNMNIISKNN
ncbi:unnamed protein product [Paramecium pentaurelia]|uniref:Transmembrane protein n=1 Tax=Paramecium pentaurelia TaxID=43138 RepID=A0A8S1WTX4_9CILI|nr:unnamed protein product [Paramecium pentaurelia]